MYVFDTASLRIVNANEAACRTTGYSQHDLLGMTLTQLTDVTTLVDSTEGGKVRRGRHRHKDGTLVSARVSVVRFGASDATHIATVTELSARVRHSAPAPAIIDLDAVEGARELIAALVQRLGWKAGVLWTTGGGGGLEAAALWSQSLLEPAGGLVFERLPGLARRAWRGGNIRWAESDGVATDSRRGAGRAVAWPVRSEGAIVAVIELVDGRHADAASTAATLAAHESQIAAALVRFARSRASND